MEPRYFVMVGNCYVAFIGLWHTPKMFADYHKATPFLTLKDAKEEAIKRNVSDYRISKEFI